MPRIPGDECHTKAGEVILTRNQLILLKALLDRPEATAESMSDWVSAARPYYRNGEGEPGFLPSVLFKSARRVSEAWVARVQAGSRLRCALTARGLAIVDGRIPAHIRGEGPYRPRGARRDQRQS